MSLERGSIAEQQARDYLIAQGLVWIKSNFRCSMGEIDLIMRDSSHLVFVEVRQRSSHQYGGAIASITYGKRQKLLKSASLYLMINQGHDSIATRFDVLCLEGSRPTITWIKDAFGVDY